MANAIRTIDAKNLTIGFAKLGFRCGKRGTVATQVHDGDTVSVEAAGNIGVRFLGIDTAEISFIFPDDNRFRRLDNPVWEPYLTDVFSDGKPPFQPDLTRELRSYLQHRIGEGVARNHMTHARAAEAELEKLISADMKLMKRKLEDFQFFLVFAHEVMDVYGRFLCFVNRDQPDPQQPVPRDLSYNERLLQLGQASPYFIWPNVNPWRKKASIVDAVPDPNSAKDAADLDASLHTAREAVRNARTKHIGIFNATDPLMLEPFELRFLARRTPPSRWLIDLSRNSNELIPPQHYHTVPNVEDRLFISPQYVPLFVEYGWKRQQSLRNQSPNR